ncbi:serine hydrolase domain-containing protein [Brevundimonas sp. 2R-24]|uniref:Serine hydrolase domain-containing protein n=1 Tax=Peiella sedimenti TaxID=3061083 RepID=A0ABT8SQZ5_9CAUL|nr:serine hydrolase domain-containing protein [Caulobacteraceae bacterium XZ-24]
MSPALALACCLALTPAPEPGRIEVTGGSGGTSVTAYGYADIEAGAPVTPETVFRLSSLTKSFTAVAVLTLVQDGRLGLDDTIGQLLPDTLPAWRDITVEQLLNQTSGLSGDMTPILRDITRDWTPVQMIQALAGIPPQAPPGQAFAYSNLNYWLLGRIIEARSGQPYWSYMGERLFAPLGLTHLMPGETAVLIPHRARGYVRDADGGLSNAPYFSGTIGYAAGGLVGTALDLALWHRALSEGRVLEPDLLSLLGRSGQTSGGPTGYGMGWYVEEEVGGVTLHHGGSSPGFRSCVFWIPGDGRFAAVLANSEDGGEPCEVARRLLNQAR